MGCYVSVHCVCLESGEGELANRGTDYNASGPNGKYPDYGF